MPCDAHDHCWPTKGIQTLVIERCEKRCGWCSKYETNQVTNLRAHARTHLKNASKGALSGITIQRNTSGRPKIQVEYPPKRRRLEGALFRQQNLLPRSVREGVQQKENLETGHSKWEEDGIPNFSSGGSAHPRARDSIHQGIEPQQNEAYTAPRNIWGSDGDASPTNTLYSFHAHQGDPMTSAPPDQYPVATASVGNTFPPVQSRSDQFAREQQTRQNGSTLSVLRTLPLPMPPHAPLEKISEDVRIPLEGPREYDYPFPDLPQFPSRAHGYKEPWSPPRMHDHVVAPLKPCNYQPDSPSETPAVPDGSMVPRQSQGSRRASFEQSDILDSSTVYSQSLGHHNSSGKHDPRYSPVKLTQDSASAYDQLPAGGTAPASDSLVYDSTAGKYVGLAAPSARTRAALNEVRLAYPPSPRILPVNQQLQSYETAARQKVIIDLCSDTDTESESEREPRALASPHTSAYLPNGSNKATDTALSTKENIGHQAMPDRPLKSTVFQSIASLIEGDERLRHLGGVLHLFGTWEMKLELCEQCCARNDLYGLLEDCMIKGRPWVNSENAAIGSGLFCAHVALAIEREMGCPSFELFLHGNIVGYGQRGVRSMLPRVLRS